MAFQHIPASPSSDTHFIASMTQKFKASTWVRWGWEAHPESGKQDRDLFLWSFFPNCEGLHPRKLSEPFRNGIGLPSTQKSKEHFDFPHNWLDPHCPQSQTLSADLVVFFNYVFAVENENKKLCSHMSPVLSHQSTYLLPCAYLSCKLYIQKTVLFRVVPPWELSSSWQHKHLLKLMRWFGSCLWES